MSESSRIFRGRGGDLVKSSSGMRCVWWWPRATHCKRPRRQADPSKRPTAEHLGPRLHGPGTESQVGVLQHLVALKPLEDRTLSFPHSPRAPPAVDGAKQDFWKVGNLETPLHPPVSAEQLNPWQGCDVVGHSDRSTNRWRFSTAGPFGHRRPDIELRKTSRLSPAAGRDLFSISMFGDLRYHSPRGAS